MVEVSKKQFKQHVRNNKNKCLLIIGDYYKLVNSKSGINVTPQIFPGGTDTRFLREVNFK